jgi:hypothetical protein
LGGSKRQKNIAWINSLAPKRSLALRTFAPGQWHCVNTLRQSQTGLLVAPGLAGLVNNQ